MTTATKKAEETQKVLIPINVQMMTMDCVRQMLFLVGMGCRVEEKNSLSVYHSHADGDALYNVVGEKLGSVFIDEGYFTDTLISLSPPRISVNPPWAEVLQPGPIFRMVVERFAPDFSPEPINCIGHNRAERHYRDQYGTRLIELTFDWVEFVRAQHVPSEPVGMTPYRMAVNNVAHFIRENTKAESGSPVDAFTASTVLGVAFCKAKEKVVEDIVNANT